MRAPDPPSLWKRISRSIGITSIVLTISGLFFVFLLPLPPNGVQGVFFVGVVALVYIAIFYGKLHHLYTTNPWVQYGNTLVSLIFIAAANYFTYPIFNVDIIYMLIVAMAGIRLNFRKATFASMMAFILQLIVYALHGRLSMVALVASLFQLVAYLAAGFLASLLSNVMRKQAIEVAQRNKNLSLLLEMSSTHNALDLQVAMPNIAEKIARGLSSSVCSIHLVEANGKEMQMTGVFPLRGDDREQPPSWVRLQNAHLHRQCVETRMPVIIRQDTPALKMGSEECRTTLFEGIQSACLVPILLENEVHGIISVGEERNWEREPFTQKKIELLVSIAAQIAFLISNARLHEATRRQVERMAVINEITRAIGSTIEMEDLLELIYKQISRVIPAESYFVGLYDARDAAIDMRVVFDEGIRYPSNRVEFGMGLSSYVISMRKPLLIRNIDEDIKNLPIKITRLGQNRPSVSWMGVPILINEQLTGLMAVASYSANAFNDDDLALLTNVAGQAAMALDNARHHAEVEERSRRDSLTGTYNHGFFLIRLDQEVRLAKENGMPVSLIMLDIDHFKKYNDTYGHVIGDQVLTKATHAIAAHLAPTDISGRWGGEEFGIILPGKTASQARDLAACIRETLASLPIYTSGEKLIPAPTVSQGIASLPKHASTASELVDVADHALYRAKRKGRDMIEVAK